jgi:serine/threonine protein kinase/Tol biopolymer transport system component
MDSTRSFEIKYAPKMTVTIGSVLGSYEVTELLGKGGFGEVYRAKDKKLKRDVAIKILPDEFSTDHDRLARFQREAEVLASLNHPNIAAIYDLAAQDQSQFLVLELVDGETLADRIARGPIPVEEALNIARQIAEALEAAHEKGVIHRDLKPANIKITTDAKVKVLDFGLAKIRESSIVSNLSNSPTLMTAPTSNVILGTASYMSPEQAKGKVADRPSDVWAFGCVLYEMLTGHQVFEGETVGEVLGGIFKSDPDWTRLPVNTPGNVRRLLRRCLQKDTIRRFGSAHDVRIEIDEAFNEPESVQPPIQAVKRTRFVWIATTAFLTSVFVGLAGLYLSQKPVAREMRLEITTPATQAPNEFALSPDGQSIVFVASGDGPQRLWLRWLDKTDAQPIAGTDGANLPFWSPDNRSIAFFANGKLKRVDIAGGSAQILGDALGPSSASWGADGTIVFSPSARDGLLRISTSGGESIPIPATRANPQQGQSSPYFLPDGHRFLFDSAGGSGAAPVGHAIYITSIEGEQAKKLTEADSNGVYLATGFLLYMRDSTLLARRFDTQQQTLSGDPTVVADPVGRQGRFQSGGAFSVALDGKLAYRSQSGGARYQLTWFDRSGKRLGVLGEPKSAPFLKPSLSPDERHVAVDLTVDKNRDVWIIDMVRGGMTRFTFDTAVDGYPVWSPDGKQIAFESSRKGSGQQIFIKPADSAAPEQILLERAGNQWPLDWSGDGKFLLYHDPGKNNGDLFALPMTGNNQEPIPIATSTANERIGVFSPDDRWVAIQTDQSGRREIVVQSFPNPGGKWQVSLDGGRTPRWSADGKELYFISPDQKLMAAKVHASATSFEVEKPIALFQTHIDTSSTVSLDNTQYTVSRDGRFL